MRALPVLCVWLLLNGSHTLVAQPLEPWVNGNLPPSTGNYEWCVASGEGRVGAFRDFLNFLSAKFGCVRRGDIEEEMFIDAANPDREQRDALTIRTFIECEGRTVWFVRIKEAYDPKTRLTHQLYQFSSTGEFSARHLEYVLVDDYDKSLANILSLAPFGVSQFYKGNKGMGNFFLISQASALVCAGLSWRLSNNYYDEYMKERDPSQRAEYQRLSQNAETLCFISAGVAGGLYVWGVLHGLFADGKRKKYELAWTPYITPNGNSGIALSFIF